MQQAGICNLSQRLVVGCVLQYDLYILVNCLFPNLMQMIGRIKALFIGILTSGLGVLIMLISDQPLQTPQEKEDRNLNNKTILFLFQQCSYATTEGEDSAKMLPADTSHEEAANPRPFGPQYPVIRVSKWQLNQPSRRDLDPST